MNIAYFARIDLATQDASTHHVLQFCKQMAQLGHRVTLYVPDLGKRERVEGVELVYIPVISKKSFITFFTFPFFLLMFFSGRCLSDPPDVVYTRHQLTEVCITWLKYLFGFTYVIEANGLAPVELSIRGVFPGWISMVRMIEKGTFPMADRVVVPSVLIRDKLCNEYGLDAKRFLVVTNAADPDHCQVKDRAICKRELGLNVDARYLVFVGSLKAWHGIDRIVEVLPELFERLSNVHLLIVGDGEQREKIQAVIKEQGVSDKVILTGSVPHHKVPLYMGAGELCLAPYFDPQLNLTGISPLKIFEYLACGRPVVYTPMGGLGQTLGSFDIGRAIDSQNPKDWVEPLIELLADPGLRDRLGENARKAFEENFTWNAVCRKVSDSLEQAARK